MQTEYWKNELNNLYFNNYLKKINRDKNFDKIRFSYENLSDLDLFLNQNDITIFEFSTFAISLYLSRSSASEGVIFAYSNLNSNDTLFKIRYDGEISVLDAISNVKTVINNASENSMKNLKDYVNELYPDYCDHIFNYAIVDATRNSNVTNEDSSIKFIISDDCMEIEYDINTFKRIEIESLLENMESLIENCLKDAKQACCDVNIVCDRQLRLLDEFSKGSDFEIDDELIPDIIFEMAGKYPDNYAINDEINRITYKELEELINSTTYILQNKYDIKKHDKILLYLSRSYNVPLLTICLMKLGAITIPVDDTYPEGYIQTIIENSSPKYIIQESDCIFENTQTIQLNTLKSNETGSLEDVDVSLDDTVMILYTSGTTGVPKGVEITQRNIIYINCNYRSYFKMPKGGDGNFMCLAKFTFVASLPIYGALMNGFEAFIIRETTEDTIPKIVEYLMKHHCYVLITTPDLGIYLYNNFDLNLDIMALAGSTLSKSEIRKNNPTVLLNGYGCTETSGSVIINKLNDDYSNYSVIGRPLGNSNAYILDDNGKQLPIGAVGEIVISGPIVTKQYFNNPEQTSKAYGKFNNEKAFYTNDLGYFDYEGNITYVGRKDNQVNLNGFRIELQEIESFIFKYGSLNQAKVILGEVNHQDHLIAYYSSDEDIDEDGLKEFLEDSLPSYMVPSFYMKMDALPLNPNGKVDVNKLPSVEFEEVEFIEPRNELEELVVSCFENAFNQENISIYDDFIQLGGTSVIAMKIVGELADYNLTVNDLMMLNTPEKIAEHINSSELIDIDWDKYSLDTGCPLNESQLNVYLDIQRYGKNEAYNLPLIINIPQKYEENDVENALKKMFGIHPILKSHIEIADGTPYLKIGSQPKIEYSEEYDNSIILNFINEPFELTRNLSRYLMVKKDNQIKLVGVFHHLIFDGISNLIFKQHLLALLEGKTLDEDIEFLKSSVYDETISKSEKYDEAEIFYESLLSEADEVNSLLSSAGDNTSGTCSCDLNASKKDVMNFLKLNNISENILFTSVFAYTLSRFTGDSKVLFNIIDNGRDRFNNFNAIGMYVNTLPLHVDCKNQDVLSFIEYMYDIVYNVMKFDYYPFRLLTNKYNIDSSILFQFIPEWIKEDNDYDIKSDAERNLISDMSDLIADFNVDVTQKGDNYNLRIIYSDKYSKDMVEHFAGAYNLILSQMLHVKELSEINYISDDDIELLESYNQTEYDLVYSDVLDAFNDNLSRYPNSKLVSYNEEIYSYAESAFIADKLAKKLIDLGVNPQDCVSFLVERSELYIFCILGIMSIGAIYVPLDDNLPDERISFMISDAKSKVVIVCDETQDHVSNLVDDNAVLLNISDIVKDGIGKLDVLPVVYGDLACILYTSGTTGIPKGVKITRKSIVNVCEFYKNEYNLENDDVYGFYSGIGFDVSIFVMNVILYAGACLSVVSNEIKLNMNDLNDYFKSQNVSHAFITTQVAKLFMNSVNCSYLDVLLTIGEKLGEVESPENYKLVDAYGPTEAFAFVTAIDNKDKIDHSSVGLIDYNMKYYVLDNNKHRVPIGAAGELYLAGCQIADGYLNRPEETAKAFVENPFDGGIMYRTGDIVRVLPDATIGFIGRRDSQVKIRGNRVELSEVESAIRDIDEVEDVTVQTINKQGNNELVAYIALSDDLKDINLVDYVQGHVNERKPDYMVPSYVIQLDYIPLNANGKVDKHALPEIDLNNLHAEYVAPRNEAENTIVEAFEKALNQEKISINDDFIRLGGDSLTAIKLVSHLDEYNISAADILSLKTPKLIAENIADIKFDSDAYSLDKGCPLNESQLNVYLDIIANDKADSYILPVFTEISNEYSADSLNKALNEILNVHPILGMCVSDEFEVPYLVKGSEPEIQFETQINENSIVEFVKRPFDLHDSLCRFLIIENNNNYNLFAVFHHLIFDVLSTEIFKHDLFKILDGKSLDIDNSFLKVSAYSQQIKKSEEYSKASEFFDLMLTNSEESAALPESVLSEEPGLVETNLDFDTDLFKTFLEENGISENALFTSTFAYTLSRFTGGNKVLFNIIDNGRDRFNNFNAIGMYVNTLPLHVDCKNQDIPSFIEYMSDIIYNVMRFDYYPFRLLANRYNINSNILFQFIPEWIKEDNDYDIKSDAERSFIIDMNNLIADFNVDVTQKGDSYNLRITYSDRYSKDMVEHFAGAYNLILSQMLNVKELSEINYISDDDIELLDSYNQTEYDLVYSDVLDAFNDNLSRYPNSKLVSYNEEIYSYAESAFIADKLAGKLIDLGVNPQDCVSFLVERSELYMFCVLGIMSMGAVYVPLDDRLPDERIKFMINDTQSKVVIVCDETQDYVGNLVDENAILLNISEIVKDGIGKLDALPVVYGDLACILYTSGTTGIPKGVKITRRSIVNVCEFYKNEYRLENDDVYGFYSGIGFDVSIFVMNVVLYAGACLSVVSNEIKLNMNDLNDYFKSQKVTHAFITTQVAKLFMNSVDCSYLDVLLTIGEKLGEFESPENYMLVDAYGPTEAFAFVTAIDNKDKIDHSSVGLIDYNMKYYILDHNKHRVPIGAAGELYLAGHQIADGYLNRPEETAKAFVENPFDEGMMYRTGDIVRVLPDGTIGFIGRRDSQVKIRGNRVELSEVESAIRDIDEVEDVAVQTINKQGNNELVAYVVLTHNLKGIDLSDYVQEHVNERKPDYMVPSYVTQLDQIPLNANGKVDKHALPEIDLDNLHAEYVAPRNEAESTIVEAFEKALNQKKISINDDFIRLGGDSLTAIKLVSHLDEYNISAADILSLKTPKLIAENITDIKFDSDIYSLDEGCPLNESQLNVYLDIIANDKIDSYIIPTHMKISNKYSADSLNKALNEILSIHPILGMRISDEFEVPYLVKGSEPEIQFETQINENSIAEFVKRPFDLHDSLCRFLIVENKNNYNLFAVFHHLIFDVLSSEVFKHDLIEILDGKSLDIDNSFLKVSAFNQQIKKSEEYSKASEFFDLMLTNSEESAALPESVLSEESGLVETTLDFDEDLFKTFLENNGISENALFTSVFAYTLSRFTGGNKVLFNIIDNGRDRFNNFNAIGMYANTLPLHVDCKNQDVSSFVRYISDIAYNVMRFNYYPFRLLANMHNIDSNILFQFIPKWIKEDNDSGIKSDAERNLISDMNNLIADFNVDVTQKGDNYNLRIIYSDKYSQNMVEHFAGSYKMILSQMLNVKRLSEINYICDDDIELLDSYNQTEYDLVYSDVLDAFNDNLSRYPNSKLVSYNEEIYSYAESAFIADKLAKKLIDLGVNPQDCVSFLVERSELYIFCVLGIMSMGAVYVPLDDRLPDERIKFMINDTQSKAVIVCDETHNYVDDLLEDNTVLLNISDIVKDGIGKLDVLQVVYGDLACILYTSGTTGIPKGVKITRKSIVNVCEFYKNEYRLENDDVYGFYSGIGFDVSIFVMNVVLYAGACLSVVSNEIKLNMNDLNDYFKSQKVTHAFITTQVAKLFMNSVDCSYLDVLLTIGEKLGEVESPKDYKLVDAYGPTEAFAFVTAIDNKNKIHYSSVGLIDYNMRYYVLDDNRHRVPIGAAGELYLAGCQIADGYLNRQEETAKAFVENPFDGGIMYRTGDIVRVLPDGTIGFIGRRDSQVKIRGNRVELSEVESAIRDIDEVEDVTVQTINKQGNNELVAYVVLTHDLKDIDLVDYVQEHVNERKPDYMVPSYVIQLDHIPLNANGKVDKHALPEIDLDNLHAEYVAPRNEAESTIVEAFEKAFNQEKISINDDFIRLGGDSLTAIKLVSHLDEYNISAADILSLKTPKLIAENITDIKFDSDIYSLDKGCPLNESQLNVYLDIIANDKIDSYIIPVYAEISNEYSADSLNKALNEILNVHPILGMCVSDEFEVPYLVKGSEPEIQFETQINENSIAEFVKRPFDLHDSLCRFLIVENNNHYNLFAVFHHLIFDVLSSEVFKHDLFKILDGKSLDIDNSFLKVSAFNQQIKKSKEYSNANEFFELMLADNEETGTLLESISPDGPGLVETNLNLNHELFKTFLEDKRISENTLFTSAFAYTLSRYAGSSKVLFNIIDNGRDRFNNFNAIGMYVNTLPLLVDCKNQDITSFTRHISDRIYNIMRFNYYPFHLLANEYNVNANILFQYIPEWIKENNGSNILEDSESSLISDMNDLIADFNVEISQKDNNYTLRIIYSNKYAKDMVERFVETYNLILSQMIQVNELSEITYITNRDIELLDTYNQTQNELKYTDILEAFNDNLVKYEDNTLVGYESNSYTHGESAFIANEISEKLTNLNVNKQDSVALFVKRSEWYLLLALGVLAKGAIYVPIETTYPEERILIMLEDTKSKVIIVDNSSEKHIREIILKNNLNIEVLNVNSIDDIGVGSANHLNCVDIDENDIACIIYTSGTTGTPKGSLITRKAINNFVSWYVDETNFTSDDVYGMHCSYIFDMHTHALYSPVITGGSLYVVPEDIRLDLKALNEYYVEHNCTHTYITSQVGKLFAERGMETTIKLLCFGGMKLGELNAPDSIGPFETYGPSENLAVSTSIFANDRIHHSSIGHFIDNVKGYVLDDEHRRVPLGAVGELYLAGHQLSPGYLNREDENIKSFLENPFDDETGYEYIYGTGDLVRFLPDGTLGIVDRRDNQVKIRGNRVELSEVESAIRTIDEIDDVTVQTVNNQGNNELIAYVVLSGDLDSVDLVDYVRNCVNEHKPDYMVPSYVVRLDHIPLNINGKIDKYALPEVDLGTLLVEYVAPTNETEKEIVDAFELAFNQKDISLFDDFIHLGGDSITAIRVASLLEKDGITCSARDILNYKTPYLIAQHADVDDDAVDYDAIEGTVDLLPIQSYFFDQINLNDYSQQFVLKFNTDLNKDILQKSFKELINIHDMLRAVYKFCEDGHIIQEILPLDTCIYDIGEHIIEDNLEESISDIYRNSTQSLDIENKLMDINLIHYEGEDYLIIVIHHLIVDGVSWNTLLTDLTHIYFRLLNNEKIDLLRPYSYKSWTEDVKHLVENISSEEKQHWIETNKLLDDTRIKGNAKAFTFKTDNDFDANNLLMLSEEEYLALAISRAYKKTFDKDIIFNRESHGRDNTITNLNRTVGWFTSIYPVPVYVNNETDDISLMKDAYSIKKAFKEVNNLGLNYASLIYTTHDLGFKHCPVTFNFLSNAFSFKNELLESMNYYLSNGENLVIEQLESETYGITFDVSRMDESYLISGHYADNTYIGDEFNSFIENIKEELSFIGNYEFGNIVCCLSESQLGVYLDEKINDKDVAYSVSGILPCNDDKTIDEIIDSINAIINKHPILKGRVLDTDELPLLICDSNINIEVSNSTEYSEFIKPFDLNKCLARFFIAENDEGRFIVYDMHHMISDATSRTIINSELELALNGALSDDVDLGFVYTSNESYESQYKDEYIIAKEFFDNAFVDIDDVQPLLKDIGGHEGCVSLPIHGVRESVESFVRNKGITVSNFLNAVFAYTYSRFTGSDKVYFTFTEHGRHETYNQDALGMFIRTIPIIVDCSDRPVEDYVGSVSDLILKSLYNSVYPFRLLAREFDLINNVTFEYNYDLNDVSDIGGEIIFSDRADRVSELLCVVNDLDDGFVVNLNHLDNLSQKTAERFVRVFEEVLIQFLDKENLRDIDYISEEDIELLDCYNQTQHDLKYEDILDAFKIALSKYPENMLVLGNEGSYSYSEGACLINQIQDLLKKNDIGVNDKVSVFVGRDHNVLLANISILSIGATYVPIDENHPNSQINYMVEKSQSKAIITTDEFESRINEIIEESEIKPKVINISPLFNDIGKTENIKYVNPSLNDVACILFTSGTTGNPKAVQIGRHSIANMAQFYAYNSEFTSEDVYGVFASVGFDVSLQHYAALLCGGAVTWVPDDIRLDIVKLNEYFIKYNVTHTILTTQISKLFVENIHSTTIRNLCAVGEKMGEINPPKEYILNDVYGPTEATSSMTSINVKNKIEPSSVGSPDWNTKIYILDSEQRRIPFGAIGELYISGHQVSKGYLNNPKANDEAFFDNPFDGEINGYNKMYKTGDIVRLLPDGTIGFIERNDSQVKIRGNRVELDEVESVIRDLTFVKDATVQTIKNKDHYELVAYVVYDDSLPIVKSVQDHVSERKPAYMVPSYVIVLDEIPLNINGKVDKKALPEVEMESLHADYVPPTTETEKIIVDAFKGAFNQEIGIYDEFTKLGGDSLKAVKIALILSKNNIEFSAMDILNEQTPYRIAKIIDYGDCNNTCTLIKRGENNQNMFLIPPMTGFSFEYSNLIHSLDFKGNIYAIDDPKFKLSLEEIMKLENPSQYTSNKFYEMTKDIFNDNDLIVGYSSGGVFALMLAEKLEKDGKVAKCILIDGALLFRGTLYTREELYKDVVEHWRHHEFDFIVGAERKGFQFEKFSEITLQNVNLDFDEPRLNSPILYLSTGEVYGEEEIRTKIDSISSADNEVIPIDSTNHNDILKVDYYKLVPYFSGDFSQSTH